MREDFLMPRTSDADQRLMEAATELIWANSYGSTSVDDICKAAGVKKGSFYHFFASKSELAVAALEADWQKKKPTLDAGFSPSVPGLERIVGYCDSVAERQAAMQCECGSVLGCPLFSLGSEIGTQDKAISAKVREILDRYVQYFESGNPRCARAGRDRSTGREDEGEAAVCILPRYAGAGPDSERFRASQGTQGRRA
jgi:TetR/AcrR family transcriptional repressor of nem operon